MGHLRRYFFAGLLVWLPIWVTLLVIRFLVEILDGTMNLLPHGYQPDQIFGTHVPGIGVVISLLVVLLTGIFASNIIGKRLVAFWEWILARIPLVRTIYQSVKQVLQTLFSSTGQSFRNVYLVEYPRKGLWSIAFQTGKASPEICEKSEADMITVFIPTTPNPTSGFLIMVPRQDAVLMDMKVDDALKMVISLGVVQPDVKLDKQMEAQ